MKTIMIAVARSENPSRIPDNNSISLVDGFSTMNSLSWVEVLDVMMLMPLQKSAPQ